jgi:hypothetical protein
MQRRGCFGNDGRKQESGLALWLSMTKDNFNSDLKEVFDG